VIRFKQDLKNDLIAGLLVVIPQLPQWLTITIAGINFSPGFQQLNRLMECIPSWSTC